MISVVIPTANRRDMLRQALRSVAAQTAAKEITEVIVSENGGDRRSADVCAEFPGLPITYLFREKPVSPPEHGALLFNGPLTGELTAVLHDDDWWAPEHLALGVEALRDPASATYYCCCYSMLADSRLTGCYENFYFWFAKGYPELAPTWSLSFREVVIASLLATPALYSSLIARTAALRSAAFIFALGNPYDNDRMMAVALAQHGTILYAPMPHAFYRFHSTQDSKSHLNRRRLAHMVSTTDWMLDLAEKKGDDWIAPFAEAMEKCPPESVPFLREHLEQPWCLPRLLERSHDSPALKQAAQSLAPRGAARLRAAVKQWLPPAVAWYLWRRRPDF